MKVQTDLRAGDHHRSSGGNNQSNVNIQIGSGSNVNVQNNQNGDNYFSIQIGGGHNGPG